MCRLLASKDIARVDPLVSGLKDQIMAQAVLDGTRPGFVFSSDQPNPSSAFIAAPEGAFAWTYLAGRSDNSKFNQALHRWIFDDKGLGEDVVFSFLVCDDTMWEPALGRILSPRVVIPDRRLHYICTETPGTWRSEVPEGYSILPVDHALLQSDIEIPEKIEHWFDHNFGSRQKFLERGFGAVAVQDALIVGWCLADSIAATRADIGPETDKAHQRKGLAYCTTCSTLEQGFERGLETIGWHCHVINTPSRRTAEKAGFQFQSEYPAYAIHFDIEKHAGLAQMIGDEIAGQATEALQEGDRVEAHRLFERALNFSTHPEPGIYVQAAQAAASCNAIKIAFARLEHAKTLGWLPPAQGSVQPELAPLMSDPRWHVLES